MARGMEQLSYEDRLREFEILQERRKMHWKDLIVTFLYLKRLIRKVKRIFFFIKACRCSKGEWFKLKEIMF